MLRQGKPWSDEDGRRVGLAMGVARDVLVGMGRAPLGPDIVFTTLEAWADIHRRMHVKGGPAVIKSLWPDFAHTYEERIEREKQRRIDIAGGDPLEVVYDLRIQVTPAEIATMESINLIFRHCLVGRNQARDMKILHRLAEGRTLRQVGSGVRVGKDRVADVKAMQCQAIWGKVRSLLPPVAQRGTVLLAA